MKLLFLLPALCLVCCGCDSQNTIADAQSGSQENSPDWQVTTRVKAVILADTSISASSHFVSVTTNNGVVTLSGNVASKDDMNKIVHLTKNVDGVKKVDNQMKVSKD